MQNVRSIKGLLQVCLFHGIRLDSSLNYEVEYQQHCQHNPLQIDYFPTIQWIHVRTWPKSRFYNPPIIVLVSRVTAHPDPTCSPFDPSVGLSPREECKNWTGRKRRKLFLFCFFRFLGTWRRIFCPLLSVPVARHACKGPREENPCPRKGGGDCSCRQQQTWTSLLRCTVLLYSGKRS